MPVSHALSCTAAGASDDAADNAKPNRRRNKAQMPDGPAPAATSPKAAGSSTPARSAQISQASAAAASTAAAKQPDKASILEPKPASKAPGQEVTASTAPNAVPEKQKASRKRNQGPNEPASGQSKTSEPAEQAQQAQRQQPEFSKPQLTAAVKSSVAAPAAPPSGITTGNMPSITARTDSGDKQAPAATPAQKQQQKQQQQRHAPAVQAATRPAPPAGNPQAPRQGGATPRGARPVPNYSAAVSGLVQNAAALQIRDSADDALSAQQPNGATAAVHEAQPKRAAAPIAAPATTAGATMSHQQRRQQQGRQPPQKLQQHEPSIALSNGSAGLHQQTALPQHQQQQQGFMQHPAPSQHPWDLPSASMPQHAGQLSLPGVDWSFQAPFGAVPNGPGGAGFNRTASSGNLATSQSAWPGGHMAATAATAGRSDSFDGATGRPGIQLHQQQGAAGNRASTSGFVVSSSPGRAAGQGHNRGQPGNSSVRPSAGILSVQMNIAGQPRPPATHAMPAGGAGGQAPYGGMGSGGQSMGVSLPSSMANNIWAVGDGKTDSLGTSAEQRPDMWASPSRSSPVRRAGGYSGPSAGWQPSLSHASEIRRVAEASGLCCPLTKDLMSDPVVLISDGYTYERAAITKWLQQNETSPITKAPLQHKDMVPNLTMRSAIQLLIPSANSQRLFPSQLERRHI